MKKNLALIVGAILELLGLLWIAQGAGLVTIEPILCFANCVPIEGPSLTWLIVGLLTIGPGVGLMIYALKGRAGRPPQ